ncbi:MAG TPA: hypothetical protein VMY38_00150 [Gemmatimonadaceae bacterium]|nr:hypothetical protein [Gemmatimonadaceae bacterium]
MAVHAPPYALAPTPFPLPALATLAGKAALGGDREVAIACFVIARLAGGLLPPHALPTELRQKRAGACRSWLASQALPTAIRSQLLAAAESTAAAERPAIAAAMRGLRTHAAKHLDGASGQELEALAARLGG